MSDSLFEFLDRDEFTIYEAACAWACLTPLSLSSPLSISYGSPDPDKLVADYLGKHWPGAWSVYVTLRDGVTNEKIPAKRTYDANGRLDCFSTTISRQVLSDLAKERGEKPPFLWRDLNPVVLRRFELAFERFMKDMECRANQKRLQFDRSAMPGTKAELFEVARKFDEALDKAHATLDTYISGRVKFKPGTRPGKTDYYKKLYPDYH